MSKYDDLLGLLEERRRILGRDWDYDPHNYQKDRKAEDLKTNEQALDATFDRIIQERSP